MSFTSSQVQKNSSFCCYTKSGGTYCLSERFIFFLLVFMMLSSIAEVITLGAVIPFWDSSPTRNLLSTRSNSYAYRFLNIDTSLDISLYVTAGFTLTAALAAVIRLINLWLGINFSASVGSDLYTSYFQFFSNRLIITVNQIHHLLLL